MRRRFFVFIAVFQSLLFLIHLLIYETWTYSAGTQASHWMAWALAVLSVSFVAASLLAFRFSNPIVGAFYKVAAVWAGALTFLTFAAILSWIILGVTRLARITLDFPLIVEILSGIAALMGLYAVLNADWTRITRVRLQLANLPETWRGRKIALISDLHLGPVRNGSFLRRMITMIMKQSPDAIFIAGDLYDGTAIDAARAAMPLSNLRAPRGVYFAAGNHEQFRDDTKYLNAIAAAGVRVLNDEKVEVDGLQIAGISYRTSTQSGNLAAALSKLQLERNRPSILLTHAPDHPAVAEAAGISLQLSGHTHLGQFIPWTWIARRVYKQFVYGLSRIGGLQVYTSSGAGTWGPPLRLGSNPEIVVLQLE